MDFRIRDSDLHIVIFDKVLIQVYNPKIVIENEVFVSDVQDLGELCDLFIIIFDFVDFNEDYNGEKRSLKKKVAEFKESVAFQIIPIENEEELYFVIRSIFESISKEDS